MVEWTYQLAFQTTASVFSGLSVAGLLDRMVVRDCQGVPIIPGSSVKGRWRFFAERFLNNGNVPEGLNIHSDNSPICKNREDACTLCRLFGNSAIPSMIWVGQAELSPNVKKVLEQIAKDAPNPVFHVESEPKPGIALSRFSRTALADHLFFDETLPAMAFSGKVLFQEKPRREEMDFLRFSGKMVDRIGSRKAVGRGILKEGIQISGGTE
jgi:CRISPR/Cas system CSM-associated protein Csm3 (group 7 of RAMP superfamily)